MLDYLNIDVNSIQEESFNSSEVIKKYRDIINSSNYLKKGTFKNIVLEGNFDENLWVYFDYIRKGNIYIEFEKLNELRFYGLLEEDILLIKSWVANRICNYSYEYSDTKELNISPHIQGGYEIVYKFLRESKNFSIDFIDDKQGSLMEEYFRKDIIDDRKKFIIETIFDYIYFIEEKFIDEKGELAILYMDKLQTLYSALSYKNSSRELPHSKDIILFDNYVKTFFSSNVSTPLKMYYYPILLWWKITNVIPMRASEFCLKLERDCLIKDNTGTYLKIGRLKKRPSLKGNLLPVLNRLKITDDIYNLIETYINETESLGETKTLISYPAIIHYRDVLNNTELLFDDTNYSSLIKNSTEYFTNYKFSILLTSFYSKIIKKMYNDTQIKDYITPNQTRHLAFTSLLLQGFSPVEIAILGGHRSIGVLDSYTCSYNSYIDNEVITIIHSNLSQNTLNRTQLKKIIFNKPQVCPISIDKSIETEIDGIKLGYCTADFTKNKFPCENNDCYNCNNWWCEPTEVNYNKLIDIIKSKLINGNDKLNRDIEFIKTLLKKTTPINLNGNLALENNEKTELRKASLNINADCKNLINLKSQLITYDKLDVMINQLNEVNLLVENTDTTSITTKQ